MIRPISIEIGLFLTPFVIYAAFLVVGSFLVLAKFSGAPPGSTYVPAHIEDGKFVPGETR
jgi:hypothetical protein